MEDNFFTWRVFHPSNNYNDTDLPFIPLITDEYDFLQTFRDLEGNIDGFMIATSTDEQPSIHEYWRNKGWQIRKIGSGRRVEIDLELEDAIDSMGDIEED